MIPVSRGMGATGPQILGVTGGALATAGVTVAALASPTIGRLAPALAIAGPIGAIAGGVIALLGAIGVGQGCGQTCIAATEYANQSATLMQQNMQAYFSLPSPRPKSAQTAALANFDALWAGLTSSQACGNPQLGDAGKRCISERQRGGKYDDFKFNRDPIANDTNVYADGASIVSGSGINSLLLIGGLVVAAVAVN